MNYLVKLFIITLLLLGIVSSCVPTDTARINPNEQIFCDISTQLNANDSLVSSEVRFYIKDSLGTRPYFLDQPVSVDNFEMDKKFNAHKGVFYSLSYTLDDFSNLVFLFTNLDDLEYRIEVPISLVETKGLPHEMKLEDLRKVSNRAGESMIVIDENNKFFNIENNQSSLEGMKLGVSRLVKVVRKDSLYQLKDKLWLSYNSKSLSKTQELLVRE